MNIAILSDADVSSWYAASLMERGHEIMFGPFGHAPTAVDVMIEDGIEGVLILTDDDENLKERRRASPGRQAVRYGVI
jgi:hypothetical protein